MNVLVTVVARYGLLKNSSMVVIAEMIHSMLPRSMSDMALAFISGDDVLLCRALLAGMSGALVVLRVGFGIGKIDQETPVMEEILARASQTSST